MDYCRTAALAAGFTPLEINGGTRTEVVERPRKGVVAWVRRHVGWMADPDPVEVIEHTEVQGMTRRDIEAIAVYGVSHGGVL